MLKPKIITSGKFISFGYTEYLARIIVQTNNKPIAKNSSIKPNSPGENITRLNRIGVVSNKTFFVASLIL